MPCFNLAAAFIGRAIRCPRKRVFNHSGTRWVPRILSGYKVTIRGNGSVRYEGRLFVREKGVREKTIPISEVKKLIQKLRDDDFLHWKEETEVCVDYPQVRISAVLDAKRKRLLEGCQTPGKILQLADEIDGISGAKNWGENVRP